MDELNFEDNNSWARVVEWDSELTDALQQLKRDYVPTYDNHETDRERD